MWSFKVDIMYLNKITKEFLCIPSVATYYFMTTTFSELSYLKIWFEIPTLSIFSEISFFFNWKKNSYCSFSNSFCSFLLLFDYFCFDICYFICFSTVKTICKPGTFFYDYIEQARITYKFILGKNC